MDDVTRDAQPPVVAPPLPPLVPHGWWRRNAIALVALAVLLPATAGAIAGQEFRTYYEGRHWQPTVVAEGGTIELGGATAGLATLTAVPASAGVEVPEGGLALAAQLTVVPGDEPVSCARPRLVEAGTDRTWESDYAPLGWQGEALCFEATAPVLINVPFVVPADAGPFLVELEILHDGPELPRFRVAQP